MGCGQSAASGDETVRNRNIDKTQNTEEKKQEEVIKLLLLGAGESGKSTIFKQMKILYGKPWDEDEMEAMRPVVFSNIVQNLKLVVEYVKGPGAEEFEVSDADAVGKIADIADDAELDASMAGTLKAAWNDPGVQQAWEHRSNFQVLDCLAYYMESLDRILEASYVPTQQDILQARVRTSGIVEEKYVIDGVNFTMFDVGGQRNERKKWIHCFDNVTAVIFVAAISEYNQVLYEDNTMNRIDEALVLFEEICNSKWFKQTAMILFLNKRDLFYEKLAEVPFKVDGQRYENFQGPHVEIGVTQPGTPEFEAAYDAASNFLKQEFVAKNKQNKEIYTHITCATDTKNVEIVFNACKDIILKGNLSGSGFM
mmetsp:Transcript_2667/g.5408  ORF Transcript_2667/g.5408 Transcript_2667/m.5408 type:complete len:368 (+) Transcript_2667:169-1272(+)